MTDLENDGWVEYVSSAFRKATNNILKSKHICWLHKEKAQVDTHWSGKPSTENKKRTAKSDPDKYQSRYCYTKKRQLLRHQSSESTTCADSPLCQYNISPRNYDQQRLGVWRCALLFQ